MNTFHQEVLTSKFDAYFRSNSKDFTFMWPCIVTDFFLIKPTRRTNFLNFISSKNSTCFGHFLCPWSRVFYCTFDISIFLAGLMTASKQGQDGTGSSILTLLRSCHQTCKKYTNVERTVENSWWWAKEMPETCRVFWQNKIWKIRASCWFY